MSYLQELYDRMEAERLAANSQNARTALEQKKREEDFVRDSRIHLADVRGLTDKDFRYLEQLDRTFQKVIELVKPERWKRAATAVSIDDVVLVRDRNGAESLTIPTASWFKCRDEGEEKEPELVCCSMPSMDFNGFFSGPERLNMREKRNLSNLVIDPANEYLERITGALYGSQEFVTLSYPLGDVDESRGELVIFADGHVFDSVPYEWYRRVFLPDHFAPEAMDTTLMAVQMALDINYG